MGSGNFFHRQGGFGPVRGGYVGSAGMLGMPGLFDSGQAVGPQHSSWVGGPSLAGANAGYNVNPYSAAARANLLTGPTANTTAIPGS